MDAEKWFREAVERHRDMVFRLAYTYLRDPADADDVTQDVFVKLLRSGKRFEGDDHLRYWLVRVTINECKSLFRKPWRRVEDIEAYAETLQAPSERHRDLLVRVMRLPEKYRVPIGAALLHRPFYGRGGAGDKGSRGDRAHATRARPRPS